MRVRTQTVLGITPIFVVLAIAIGFVMYTAERREITWGLEEESSSLAVSVAEFLNEGRPGGGVEDLGIQLSEERIQKLTQYGQLKLLRQFRLEGDETSVSSTIGEASFEPSSLPSEKELALLSEPNTPFAIRPLESSKEGILVASSLAAVRNGEDDIVAYIEAVIDASHLEIRSRKILWRGGALTLGLAGIGYLLSMVISGFLTRRLSRLEKAARIVAEGGYDQKINVRTIKEVNDLGGTFNTMSSIIRDTLAKARTQLVESEQFREPVDLASACRRLTQSEQQIEKGHGHWSIGIAGSAPSGAFAGLVDIDGHTGAFLGHIEGEQMLEVTTCALSAQSYLTRLLESGAEASQAIERLGNLFKLDSCQVLIAEKPGTLDQFTQFSWTAETGLKTSKHQVTADAPVVVTDGSSLRSEMIQTFMESAGGITAQDLAFLFQEKPLASYFIGQVSQ